MINVKEMLQKLSWVFSLLLIRASLMSFSFFYLPSQVSFVLLGDAALDLIFVLFDRIVLRVTEKPADHYFAFGYGKFQHGWSLLRACFSILVAILLSMKVAKNFFFPVIKSNFYTAQALLLGALLATTACTLLERAADPGGHNLLVHSRLIHHYRAFIAYSTALWSNWLLKQEYNWVDSTTALLGLCFLMVTGFKLAKQALENLCDRQLPSKELLAIRNCLKHSKSVSDQWIEKITRIRSRQSGSKKFVEIEMEFPGGCSVQEATMRENYLKEQLNLTLPSVDVVFLLKASTASSITI